MDKELVRKVLKEIAGGVWDSSGGTVDEIYHITQCHFCCTGPHSEHAEWCPVRISKEILDGDN